MSAVHSVSHVKFSTLFTFSAPNIPEGHFGDVRSCIHIRMTKERPTLCTHLEISIVN